MKTKILHITSVHSHKDTRIYMKECKSLSKKFEVHLINPNYTGKIDEVNFHRINFFKNKFLRILSSWIFVLPKSLNFNYKIIHFHDPELMLAIPIWKLFGKKVIYDVHENYVKQMEVKAYIPKTLKKILKTILPKIEVFFSKMVDGISIVHKDLNLNLNKLNKHVVVSNAPILDYDFIQKPRKKQFCYVGLISEERGLYVIAKVLQKLQVKFVIAGKFSNKKFEKKMLKLHNVSYKGYLNLEQKVDLISESVCGSCTFLPIEHHLVSNPNKIYEYLNYGTPVICSNFQSYKDVIPEDKSFIYYCDITNENDVLITVKNIISKSDNQINEQGKLGNLFIAKNYNWNIEEKKLFELYERL